MDASTMQTRWRELSKTMELLMDTLEAAEMFKWRDYAKAPRKGVYVFYEDAKATYVGRSNKDMPNRIRVHGAESSDHHSATFAFKLLRKQLNYPKETAREIEQAHKEDFRGQRRRVQRMTFKAVSIPDPLEQALFETYAILHMETAPEHNDFDTH